MELNQHFIKIADCQFPIIEAMKSTLFPQDSIDFIVANSIDDCLHKLGSNSTKEHLELLRLLLCLQYKSNYKCAKDNVMKHQTEFNQLIQFLVDATLCNEKENQTTMCDVLVLHIVLYHDEKKLIDLFENFQTSKDNKCYLKILKCFLDALEIICFLNEKGNIKIENNDLVSYKNIFLTSVMYHLQIWIQSNQIIEWCILYSILYKIITIAKSTKILVTCIHEILSKNYALTAVCALSDIIFPDINFSDIDIDYTLYFHTNLWSLIQKNVISAQSLERKQALYFFKRLVYFIDIHEEKIRKMISLHLLENEINPFICNQTKTTKLPIKQIRDDFVLVMETLEEKQKHLVIPSLTFVDNLIDGTFEHKSCGNCFDSSWIYCIFVKILEHDNNAVVKWGLLKLFKHNFKFCDNDTFIHLITKSLNNTFLYEDNNDENKLEICNALTNWFIVFQNINQNFTKKFIDISSEISWGPIPIFYVLDSLFVASNELKNITWEQEQLNSIRTIVQLNIKLHPLVFRSISQFTLFKLLSVCYKIENLTIFSDFLSVFSETDLKELPNWYVLTSLVAQTNYDVAFNFINEICTNLKVNDANVNISMSMLSIIIQLLYEGKVICQTKQCAVRQELITLFRCLEKISVRPYVNISLVLKIIDLIYNLLNLHRQIPEFVSQHFFNYREDLFKFILKLFSSDNLSYEHVLICDNILKNINYYSRDKVNTISIITDSNSKVLNEKCMQILCNANEYSEVKLLFALQLWNNIFNYCEYEDEFFFKLINDLLHINIFKNYNSELIGKIGYNYFILLSKIIKSHIFKRSTADLEKSSNWLEVLSFILDVSGNEVIIYFGDIMHLYSTTVLNNNEKLKKFKLLLKSFINYNFISKRNKIFWIVIQKLTMNLNCSNFLDYKEFQDVSEEFTNRLLIEGDSSQGLKYILLIYSEVEKYFKQFMKTILNGLLHGQVMRRDQRIGMQACMKSINLFGPYKVKNEIIANFDAYAFINRQCNIDAVIRAVAVVRLYKALHTDKENASLLLPLVLEKLSAIQEKRYYADSQLHRLKHRIYQTLLILQPYLSEESSKILHDVLCNSVLQDTDQHSIRLMREWLLIRIYLSNKNLLPALWSFFDKVCQDRPSSASSVIGIMWHISQQLMNSENNSDFIRKALLKLCVCCMGQQFGMRLFGQVFFTKFYELLDENSTIKSEYLSFYKVTLESLNNGNLKKNPIKINEDFYYTVFDPLKHYSLETVYYQLPRLCNVSFEEWIPKEIFEEQISLLNNSTIDFIVSNSDSLLDKAEIPHIILKSSESGQLNEIQCSGVATDIQKKITPWKSMIPNEEELKQIAALSYTNDKIKNKPEIIIVASLIDKVQNLGGIARTCEIFGIKELVISNSKLIEEKDFQALSVSADKWIKITEVKSYFLTKYLLNLKDCGWTLIGAEQTCNSINLFNFKFPAKTALILGHEKTGIPANIIPLLDICVEIPQFGIIRSLNVHVTSAICIWEYIKQNRLTI